MDYFFALNGLFTSIGLVTYGLQNNGHIYNSNDYMDCLTYNYTSPDFDDLPQLGLSVIKGYNTSSKRLSYTRERLFNYRRHSKQHKLSYETLSQLKNMGLLHYRGNRGGRNKLRSIDVIVTKQVNSNHKRTIFHLNSSRYKTGTVLEPRINVSTKCAARTKRSRCLIPIFREHINSSLVRGPDFPNIMLINCNSLAKPHAIEGITADVIGNSVDILFVTETHFKPSKHPDSTFSIKDYACFRKDRVGRKGGGVAIYSRNSLQPKELTPIETKDSYEIVILLVKFNNNIIVCICIYHPPRPIYDVNEFTSFLQSNIDYFSNIYVNATIVLCGDFNGLCDETVATVTGLTSLVTTPTRGRSCLDRIYVANAGDIVHKTFQPTLKTDHLAVLAYSACNRQNVKTKKTVQYRPNPPELKAKFSNTCATAPDFYESLYQIFGAQEAFDYFYKITNSLFDRFFPLKSITMSEADPQFVTPEIKTMLRKKNRLMKKGEIAKANAISEKISTLIIRANASKLSQHSVGNNGNITKILWDEVRKLTGKTKSSKPINSALNADDLNNHYQNISSDPNYKPVSKILITTGNSIEIFEQEVYYALIKLKSTSPGIDGLPFWFLKLAAPVISKPLTYVLNLSLKQFRVPDQWKIAEIHPVEKIKNPLAPPDYRPISVLPILSRLTERIIVRNFINPFLCNPSPPFTLSNQFAYRSTSSTTCALIAIFSTIVDMLKDNQYVTLISFDYSKAFDTLAHYPLANKLLNLNIDPCIFNWITDYLGNRKHVTKFNSAVSNLAEITASIVQGSVLGPTLFNINSMDLAPLSPLNRYFKYADDGQLLVPGTNSATIQSEIMHHQQWAASCNLKLNINKTKEIVFCRRRVNPPPPLPNIERVQSIKILGVIVDNKLRFDSHFENKITECSQTLFALRTLKAHGLNATLLSQVFNSITTSKLFYAIPSLWGFLNKETKNRIQAFLTRAKKWGYCSSSDTAEDIVTRLENNLFKNIVSNPDHCLHYMLPEQKPMPVTLRKGHGFTLPPKDDRQFITRMLYKNIY